MELEPKTFSLSGKQGHHNQCLVLQKFTKLRNQLRLSTFLHQSCIKGTIMADLLISTDVYPWRDHTLFWMVCSNSCSSNTAIRLQLQYLLVDYEVVVKTLYLSIYPQSIILHY